MSIEVERIGPSGVSRTSYERHWTSGPISGARFLVELCTNNDDHKGDPHVQAAFQSVSGIGWSRSSKLHRSSAEQLNWYPNFGGKVSYSDVTLTKGVIGDSAFLRWVLGSVSPKFGKNRETLVFSTKEQDDKAFKDKSKEYLYGYEDKNSWDNISEESKVESTFREIQKDVIIKAYDIYGNFRVKWVLSKCCPMAYKVGNLNAESDAVLVETITLGTFGVQRYTEEGNNLKTGGIPRFQ